MHTQIWVYVGTYIHTVIVGYRLTDSQVSIFMHAEYNFSTYFIQADLVTIYGHILSDQSEHLFLDILYLRFVQKVSLDHYILNVIMN